MSLTSRLGPVGNLLDESPEHARAVLVPQPLLADNDLARLRAIPSLSLETANC